MINEHIFYTTKPGDTFASILTKLHGITSHDNIQKIFNITKAIKYNEFTAPTPYHPIRPYELIVFPPRIEKEDSSIILPPNVQRCANQIKCLPQSDKEVIAQLDTADDFALAEAITEWAKGYGFLDLSGDTNTGAGTAIGMAAQRATPFVDKINQLDAALVDYRALANRVGPAKQAAKLKVLKLHEQLNQQFGKEIKEILLKNTKAPSRSPLLNADRALNIARSGRRPPNLASAAKIQSISTFSKYSKPIGKGLVALDLGIRGWKIYDAKQQKRDWYRELAVQSGGLLGASLTGAAVASIAAAVVLGPFGLILLLFVGAAFAIGMDYLGQKYGGQFYDYTRTLY